MRHGALAALNDRDLLAVGRRAGEGGVDLALRRSRPSADDRAIAPIDTVVVELAGQTLMRAIGLGGDHQPAGILVDPVDDPRPRDAADARQAALAMVEQSVDQCAVEIARRWVDDEAGGLVDNDQMFVFVSDDEGDILRLVVRQRRVGHRDVQPIPRARALGGIAHHHPVARHRAAGDQHLQPLA